MNLSVKIRGIYNIKLENKKGIFDRLSSPLIQFYVVLILSGVLIFVYINWEYTLITSTAPNKKYTIIVKYKEPPGLFGSSDVNIYYKTRYSLFKQKLIKTYIANDWGVPQKGDCIINGQIILLGFT